jgi:hypothetical protein
MSPILHLSVTFEIPRFRGDLALVYQIYQQFLLHLALRRSLCDNFVLKCVLLLPKYVISGQPKSMAIEIADLATMSQAKTIHVRTTYWTCQKSMNAPTSKNVICLEIMDRPQVWMSKIELMLLVTVVRFDSYPQLLQLFNQWFQYHIEALIRMIRTR